MVISISRLLHELSVLSAELNLIIFKTSSSGKEDIQPLLS